ncbi:hypothetical protein A8709_22295 [Paenibacillus pectinilyticus]|uniref:DUF2642 domain-containing protein n=1 Tax=Paenibacillus pectinilyticus TaxID=512399 RepID=A0A1C0ZR90_9BACL|nr:hypothetical protein [Paenibacillus pectinilyticus]OCT10580.1 hypothetical protein A8709_22295 [Paenibacillus pectinilyticus]
MFEVLITRKKEVRIRCGKDELQGVISQYYPEFQLIKINNIMIPIGLIEQIEIMKPDEPTKKPLYGGLREHRSLHLVARASCSK